MERWPFSPCPALYLAKDKIIMRVVVVVVVVVVAVVVVVGGLKRSKLL